jgi:hypothetical protein
MIILGTTMMTSTVFAKDVTCQVKGDQNKVAINQSFTLMEDENKTIEFIEGQSYLTLIKNRQGSASVAFKINDSSIITTVGTRFTFTGFIGDTTGVTTKQLTILNLIVSCK